MSARPRTELDDLMDEAYVEPACSYGQPLYRVNRDLLAMSELRDAAGVKRKMFHCLIGAGSANDWFATVGLIATRCRPRVSLPAEAPQTRGASIAALPKSKHQPRQEQASHTW